MPDEISLLTVPSSGDAAAVTNVVYFASYRFTAPAEAVVETANISGRVYVFSGGALSGSAVRQAFCYCCLLAESSQHSMGFGIETDEEVED